MLDIEMGRFFFRALASKFLRDERGATAVEYAFLVLLIAVVVILAVAALGNNVLGAFNCFNESLSTKTNAC